MNDKQGIIKKPGISVVIVVGDRRQRAGQALQSVLAQDAIQNAEVLIVDAGASGARPLAGQDHPRVTVLGGQGARSYGGLKAIGVRAARAEIVAFLEDHSLALSGWLSGLGRAFESPWTGVGGACYPSNPGAGWSLAVGSMTYGRWWPPQQQGETDMIPGNNSAYRRRALLDQGQALDDLLTCDTLLQWRLRDQGQRLYLAPIAFGHRNETSLRSAWNSVYSYHRCFAHLRARAFDWKIGRKLAYGLLSLATPWLRWLRLVKAGLRNGSRLHQLRGVDWLRVLFLQHAAAAGQALGLLFGLGSAERRLIDVELNAPRPGLEPAALPDQAENAMRRHPPPKRRSGSSNS